MRDYLKSDERMQLLAFMKALDYTNKLLEWDKYNNLTADEKKALKTCRTWGVKASKSILNRLDNKSIQVITNNYNAGHIIFKNEFEINIMSKKVISDIKARHEENKEYFDLVELAMWYNCAGCKKESKNCLLFEHFMDMSMPCRDENDIPGKCYYSLPEREEE